MPSDLDLNVSATTRGLHEALQAIEDYCTAQKVDADVLARARIVVEELFTNTIKYGYGGECERPVRLSLRAGHALTATFEDDAPAFDPTIWKPAKDRPELPSDRPVGQAGIAMVMGLSAVVSYQRLPDGNRITFVVERHGHS